MLGKPLLFEHRELAEAVTDDGPAIMAWIERQIADARQDVQDFRRSHRELEAKSRRFQRWLDRELAEDQEDDEEEEDEESSRRLDFIDLREDAELDWYQDEIRERVRAIYTWRRCLQFAKDVAGIELLPTRSRYRDDPARNEDS